MNPEGLGSPIGIGARAEVYDLGAAALKLYTASAGKTPAFREAAILAIVEELDLPAPRVHAVQRREDRWGLVMSKAAGPSFGEGMQGAADPGAYLAEMARLHALIHSRPGRNLPSHHQRLRANIEAAPSLGATLRRRLLDGLIVLPHGDRLCHGDFHPFNIIGPPGEAVVVDWADASEGSPAADVCRSLVLISAADQAVAAGYVEAYCALTGIDADSVHAWLPFVAAARLAEGVPQETDRLLALAERL